MFICFVIINFIKNLKEKIGDIMHPCARLILSCMLLIALFSLGSCSSTHNQSLLIPRPIYGQIIDDYYYAPNGLFSVKVPTTRNMKYIEECFAQGMMPTVIFQDEIGALVRIEVVTYDDFLMLKEQEKKESCPKIFHSVSEASITTLFPSAKTILEEQTEQGYLAIVDIPGASTMADSVTYQRTNGVRAFLLSFQGNQLVIISYQDFISSNFPTFTQDLSGQKQYFLTKLSAVLATFQDNTKINKE